jgi:hypothetical protein
VTVGAVVDALAHCLIDVRDGAEVVGHLRSPLLD